jgi:hypothetical protein
VNWYVLGNCGMNLALAVVFVALNQWALRNSFEETFVTLALYYGALVTLANAGFIALICRPARVAHSE